LSYPWLDATDDDEPLASDQPPTESLPKQLRKMMEAARKKAEEAEKRAAELEAKLHQREVVETIKGMGLPEKVAKFVPAGADVNEWLKEHGDVFGWKPNAAPEEQSTAESSSGAIANATPETVDAMQRIAGATTSAMPEMSAIERQMAALNSPDLTEEKLLRMINGEELV